MVRMTNVPMDPGLVPPLSQIPARENTSVSSGRIQYGCFCPFSGRHSTDCVH